MKKPLFEGKVPNCPKCGSGWVLRNFYMDEPEYELEIEVKERKVEVGKWKKVDLPLFHCIECSTSF